MVNICYEACVPDRYEHYLCLRTVLFKAGLFLVENAEALSSYSPPPQTKKLIKKLFLVFFSNIVK